MEAAQRQPCTGWNGQILLADPLANHARRPALFKEQLMLIVPFHYDATQADTFPQGCDA